MKTVKIRGPQIGRYGTAVSGVWDRRLGGVGPQIRVCGTADSAVWDRRFGGVGPQTWRCGTASGGRKKIMDIKLHFLKT